MTLERAWTIASPITVGAGGCYAMLDLPALAAWPPFLGMLICFGIVIAGVMREQRDGDHGA